MAPDYPQSTFSHYVVRNCPAFLLQASASHQAIGIPLCHDDGNGFRRRSMTASVAALQPKCDWTAQIVSQGLRPKTKRQEAFRKQLRALARRLKDPAPPI